MRYNRPTFVIKVGDGDYLDLGLAYSLVGLDA